MASAADHYANLGVAPAATAAEIKAAYRRRSRELHPDRNRSPAANREMAALNASYAILADPDQRERYDLSRPRRYEPARTAPVEPPVSGRGSIQPDRRPDWYTFLGIPAWSNSAEILDAARRISLTLTSAGYTPDVEARIRTQLRLATEWLTTPALRDIYDGAMEGVPPPAGKYPELHEHWYSYLGVRPSVSADHLAESVAGLAGQVRKGSREQRELNEAWKTLRDPARRAAYDESLAALSR